MINWKLFKNERKQVLTHGQSPTTEEAFKALTAALDIHWVAGVITAYSSAEIDGEPVCIRPTFKIEYLTKSMPTGEKLA